eukprot:TRINITY_DN7673_c0_g1_i1.p1 TRINITY_DN7673_c0_g1~~TRINITY_DN7673_c0_g1_i1.p1  ORF type:complete len:175 (-),score=21.63 TRINITY_DN7673_c0_g1_i1:586-1110(-)
MMSTMIFLSSLTITTPTNCPIGDDCSASEADSGSPQAPLQDTWDFELSEQEFWEGPPYVDVESVAPKLQIALVAPASNKQLLDSSKSELDYSIPFGLIDPIPSGTRTVSEDHLTVEDFIAHVIFPPKTASDEITPTEILAIYDQIDNLTWDGRHLINGRPTTRMSSCDFARTWP